MLPLPEYKTHNHVKFLLNYHFVFIPKRRKSVLLGEVATRLRQTFLELSIEKGWDILALEVAPDTPSLVIKLFKGRSSHHLRAEFPHLKKLPSLWISSYFVSTAGNISSEAVIKYIEDPHHAAN
jgi:putative transposase